MSDSEQSVDTNKKRFSNVIWIILVVSGLAWWFYPQLRVIIYPEKLSVVSQDTAEEMQPLDTVALEIVVGDAATISDGSENVGIQDASVGSLQAESSTAAQALEPNQVNILPQTTLVAPKFDLVRIEEDGSAVIAGLADGMGFVVLSVDGVELPEARADLNGQGQFVIFALLPPKQVPQALKLHLYTKDGNPVIISTETIFVAAAPEIELEDVVVIAGTDTAAETSDESTIPTPAQSEVAEITNQPTVILADESGVRVLQDASQNQFSGGVSIDTISYNLKGEVSIGGRAAERGFVRLYLDNKIISTSQISDSGYWTVDLLDIAAGIYILRVDELNLAGKVLSRAETPFKREQQEALVALMDTTDDTLLAETSVIEKKGTQQPTEITQITVEVQAEVEELVASINGMGLETAVSGAASKATVTKPSKADTALTTPSLTFRIKTVQPGSTLWAIARESYGAGIEYFKVFEANKERIRDPDLIYPGQVFEIPD